MVLYGRATYVQWAGQSFDLIDVDSGGLNVTTESIPIPKYGTSVIEYAPGYTDYGSLAVTIGTDNAASIAALRQMHEYNTVAPLVIILASGLEITGNAFITNFGDVVDKHGLYTLKITFKLAAKTTATAAPSDVLRILPPSGTKFFRGGSYTLSLSGSDAYSMAGGNAVFSVVEPEQHEGIAITGNLLTINSDAPSDTFSVNATISPLGSGSTTLTSVNYTVIIPLPSSIEIIGPDTVEAPATTEQKQQYTANTYPEGSDTSASWKLYKYNEQNKKWEEVVSGDKISISSTGELKIESNYPSGTKSYQIKCTSTKITNLIATKIITVKKASE